jgi:restriction endonuclease
MPKELILASEIPWEDLRGKDLEECVYWLLDAMGAKDLEWRVGGIGHGASDKGRDLECYFYGEDPEGEPTRLKWWVEVKGRAKTVEPASVKDAVLNASGGAGVDVLVIATNSRFSNPTRDCVRESQASRPRPAVRLWDRSKLEKLASAHPDVIIRLFAKALSPQGRLEVVRSRFWNYCSYSDEPTLKVLWQHRLTLDWSEEATIAVMVGEIANGNIARRPWALLLPEAEVLSTLGHALVNLLYFCARADQAGIKQHPYIKGVAYLTLVGLQTFSAEIVARLFAHIWEDAYGHEIPEEISRIAIQPVLRQLTYEIRDVCVEDCSRVTSELGELTEQDRADYWDRLRLPTGDSAEDNDSHRILTLEAADKPCKVGFDVDVDNRCPIITSASPSET